MALSANTVWEINPGGADTNSGGFITGASGTDYSQQTTPQYSLTGLTTTGVSTIILTASASADMVGNIINMTAGTNFTVGFYQIVSVSVGVSITVDRNVSSGVGASGTATIGGAFASIGQLGLVLAANGVNGMISFIKNTGTVITITSATVNISGGTFQPSTIMIIVQGYTSTRTLGNTDAAPTIQLNVISATVINVVSSTAYFVNIIFDGNNKTTSKAYSSNVATFENCTFKNFNSTSAGSAPLFIDCTFTANSANFTGNFIGCEAYSNTSSPFILGSTGNYALNCISYNNTGAATDGFSSLTASNCLLINCTAYNNGRDGFRITVGLGATLINCYAESNSANGYTITNNNKMLINCSYFSNSGTNLSITGTCVQIGTISTVSASVFAAATMNNFALNSTSGAGALLRAAGFPSLFPRGITTSFLDVGAAQHQDAGGSVFSVDISNVSIAHRFGVAPY